LVATEPRASCSFGKKFGVAEKQDELKRSFKHPASLFIPRISNARNFVPGIAAATKLYETDRRIQSPFPKM